MLGTNHTPKSVNQQQQQQHEKRSFFITKPIDALLLLVVMVLAAATAAAAAADADAADAADAAWGSYPLEALLRWSPTVRQRSPACNHYLVCASPKRPLLRDIYLVSLVALAAAGGRPHLGPKSRPPAELPNQTNRRQKKKMSAAVKGRNDPGSCRSCIVYPCIYTDRQTDRRNHEQCRVICRLPVLRGPVTPTYVSECFSD